ncbi:[NiFe]-hydrogenase assembly chaperone HybE [Marinobacterium mangrovicola]|uniref:[NiFe]-hydrogenase assembly chaperone HybE n=1 Tax=Marinobacterium mangrovicola TaxID=1476959 RepID=UPI001404D724|nr:[NiFe]-hydrogenase assembly chaperone HybE [Marinobacterium mangrovicola]
MTEQDSAAEILQVYREATARMAGLPMYNPALEPAMFGWQQLDGAQVGILILPWCLNLVWRPDEPCLMPPKGESCVLSLASGEYEGIVAYNESVGHYGSASLLSDTLGLQSQVDAQSLAAEIAALIFTAPQPSTENNSAAPDAAAQAENPRRRELFRRMLGASQGN